MVDVRVKHYVPVSPHHCSDLIIALLKVVSSLIDLGHAKKNNQLLRSALLVSLDTLPIKGLHPSWKFPLLYGLKP